MISFCIQNMLKSSSKGVSIPEYSNHRVVILTDLRLPILLASLQIARRHCKSKLLMSKALLRSNDYGQNSPTLWKSIKIFISSIFFDITIIDEGEKISLQSSIGIYSSLVSFTYDHLADYKRYPELFDRYHRLANSAQALAEYIVSHDYLEIYVYNGRFSSVQPIVDYCRKHLIKVWFLEYGNMPYHFTLQDYPIHDFKTKALHSISAFNSNLHYPGRYSSLSDINSEYNLLTHNRFSKHTETHSKYNYGIFLSSPHELIHANSSLHEYSDYDFCKNIINQYGCTQSYIIKMHPNMANDPSWPSLYEDLCSLCQYSSSITILTPLSSISSISLIANVDTCIIPFSSLSIVAFVMGRPVKTHPLALYHHFIEYLLGVPEGDFNRNDLIKLLYHISKKIDQEPLEFSFAILYRLFINIDSWLSRSPHKGLTHSSKSYSP